MNSERDPVPDGWTMPSLGEIAGYKKTTVDPSQSPDEVFDYYSIPAWQEYGKPIPERGGTIRSAKLLVESGTVLFGKLNPRVPKVWLVEEGSERRRLASTEFIPLVPADGTDVEYLYYLAQSRFVLDRSMGLVTGSTPSRQRVDVAAFVSLPVPLPPLPEQRAIAHVLRTVQRARETTEQVVAAARELERSLSQYLFRYGPMPPSEIGTLRMAEFEGSPIRGDWSLEPIGKLASRLKAGGTPKRGDSTLWNGTIPFVKIKDVTRSKGRVRSTQETVTEKALGASSAWLVPEGAVLLTMYGTIGVPAILDVPAATNQAILALVPSEAVDAQYLYFALAHFGPRMVRLNVQSTQKNIGKGIVEHFKLPLPSRQVQETIATCLAASKGKNEAETRRLEALDALFVSLLRDLMTGRRRVGDFAEAS